MGREELKVCQKLEVERIQIVECFRSHFGSRILSTSVAVPAFQIHKYRFLRVMEQRVPQPISSPRPRSEVTPEASISHVGGASGASNFVARLASSTDLCVTTAPALLGSCALTSTAPAAGATSSSHFTCQRCRLSLPLSEQSNGTRSVCSKDVNSCKGLSERWQKNRALRTWWLQLGLEQHANWYRKQHQIKPGSKRNYDELMYSDVATESVGEVQTERDHFKPWWFFKRDGLAGGQALADIERYWLNAVENRTADALLVRGEWCVAMFEGVFKAKRRSSMQSQNVSRSKNIENADQLAQLKEVGQQVLN